MCVYLDYVISMAADHRLIDPQTVSTYSVFYNYPHGISCNISLPSLLSLQVFICSRDAYDADIKHD